VSFRAQKWGSFESVLLISGIYSLQIAMGLWYQIGLRDGIIWQRAFGKRRVSWAMTDITSIGNEKSDARTLAAMNRPFRRIAIQGSTAGAPVTIDVSTKHFVTQDIQRLMHTIQEARPDLTVPKKWL